MITSKLNFLPKNTVEIEITIPWEDIKTTYDKKLDELTKSAEVKGFRKGKAPKKIIESNIDKSKLYEEVVKDVVPKAYTEAVNGNRLKPVISPKIEVVKAKENEEWIVKAKVALKPDVKLKEYKQKIKALKNSKKIWTPGTDPKKEEEQKISLDQIVKALLDEAEAEISDLLITDEANRMLAGLVDQTQKLGMSVEQYLMAKGKTTEQIRAEYAVQAENNLKLEFALLEIADQEKITADQKDIENIIAKAEKEEEKEKLRKDSYYLAHLIRQQKTLDYLSNL